MNEENQPTNLFVIKFEADDDQLKDKSIPIYDLANTFISIQRIFNKAYLAKNGKLEEDTKIKSEEREQIALQLSSHSKGSDIYGFSSFITDPKVQELVKELAVQSIIAMSGYAAKNVIEKVSASRKKGLEEKKDHVKNEKSSQSQPGIAENKNFLSAIYNDVFGVVRAMRERGVVTRIQISLAGDDDIPPVVFDQSSRNYMERLEEEITYGEYQELEGRIKRLEPDENLIVIRKKQTKDKLIKVSLSRQDFEKIRRSGVRVIKFGGRPVFPFGKPINENKFDRFEASTIISAEE